MQDCERSIILDPSYLRPVLLKARILGDLGKHDIAGDTYHKILRLEIVYEVRKCRISVFVPTIMQKEKKERANVLRAFEREKEKAMAEVHDKFNEIIKRHGSEMSDVKEKAVMELHLLRMGLKAAMALAEESDEVRHLKNKCFCSNSNAERNAKCCEGA